jgi:hypothetical protein
MGKRKKTANLSFLFFADNAGREVGELRSLLLSIFRRELEYMQAIVNGHGEIQ